ncbi:MAG: hypothetical protein LBV30_04185 [Propionibacteriaceae bacterium]|nr:hypothetical protein [Propionibacteriaceae bacterium]
MLIPTSLFQAATALGLGVGLATCLYWGIQGFSWAALAMAFIGAFDIGAVAASAIWAYAKKVALKTFLTW